MARPRKITAEVEEAILRGIRLGLHPERAALAAGIKPGTMRMHKMRNAEFVTAIKEAEAAAERGFLSRIIQHSQRNWTAAAWMLERRFPDRWRRQDGPQQVKVSGNVRNAGPAVPSDAQGLADYAAVFAAAAASLRLPEHEDPPADPT